MANVKKAGINRKRTVTEWHDRTHGRLARVSKAIKTLNDKISNTSVFSIEDRKRWKEKVEALEAERDGLLAEVDEFVALASKVHEKEIA